MRPEITITENEKGKEAFILIEEDCWDIFNSALDSLYYRLTFLLTTYGFILDDIISLKIFLSDIANQQREVKNLLKKAKIKAHLSLIEQPPTSGTKIVLLAYIMKSNTSLRAKYNLSNGLKVFHGTYTPIWIHSLPHSGNFAGTENQVKSLFTDLDQELIGEGLTIKENTIRTWIYIRDIDNNYFNFCNVRNWYFKKIGLTKETHFITSTGIEGSIERASQFYCLDSLSISGLKKEQIKYLSAKDYLCHTSEYKTGTAYGQVGQNVAFERGTCVTYGDRKHVFISGTASINKEGEILFQKDVLKQTKRTLENIEALLATCGAALEDMNYLIVYLRDASDHQTVKSYLNSYLPKKIPYVIVKAHVCNPAWLVECETFCSIIANNKEFEPFF